MSNENNTSKSVDKLKMYFKKNKSESYPITDHPLEQADEYTKGIYITMLCTIMCNNSEPREEQRLFIERLKNGIGVSGNINDYIKKALEIDDKFAEDFVRQFKDNELKYNFVVDALVLVSSIGNPKKKDVDFISEICDMFAISKDDIRIFSRMALGIVEQDSEKFIDTSDNNLELEKVEQFKYYYKDFFQGELINNDEIVYYYASEKKELDFKLLIKESGTINFIEKSRVFENYIINLKNIKFEFKDCKEIKFINSDFIGQSIDFTYCNNIIIKNCEFSKFNEGTFNLLNCNNIFIKDTYFKDCSKYVGRNDGRGGVIYSKELKKADIIDCRFYDCSLSTDGYNSAYGAIFYACNNTIVNLKGNEFNSCIIRSNRGNKSLFCNVANNLSISEDNKIINSNCELTF